MDAATQVSAYSALMPSSSLGSVPSTTSVQSTSSGTSHFSQASSGDSRYIKCFFKGNFVGRHKYNLKTILRLLMMLVLSDNSALHFANCLRCCQWQEISMMSIKFKQKYTDY